MNETLDFFMRFFKNLGSEVKQEENSMIVNNIPPKFEKFCGKKGPYKLSFDIEREGYELVTQNHYMINSIKEFLSNSGETSLLKIDFEKEIKEELEQIIPFRNGKIKNIAKISNNNLIIKFSFLTEYYYLNEKESVVNSIYVCDGKIFDFNEKLKLSDGSKHELLEKDLSKEYELAKLEIQEKNKLRIDNLSEKLNKNLEEEIARIRNHYSNKIKEIKDQEISLNQQIETNKEDKEKVKKLKKALETIKSEESEEKLNDEEKLSINNEIKKYSLRINNKLINTSLIYYPVYDLTITVEISKGEYKIIELKLDPYYNKINPVYCKNCKKELKEIIICSSGHLTCRDCGDKCIVCGSVICKECQTEKCSVCGVETCKKCSFRCEKCGKRVCLNHLRNSGGRKICSNCFSKETR